MYPVDSLPSNVLMWGAPSSGKTTLFNGFLKQISTLNSSKSHEFTYSALDGRNGMPLFPETSRPLPTLEVKDQIVHIQRYPKNFERKYISSCQFRHEITIRDVKGQDSVDFSKGDFNNNYGVSFEYFDNIIVTLDAMSIDHDEVLQNFQRLCAILTQKNFLKKHLAICITKKDRANKMFTSPEQLFDETFLGHSQYFRNILSIGGVKYDFFATSAVGYYYDAGKQIPNYDGDTGWLKNQFDWAPEKVADPFFWLFSCIEENYLNNKAGRKFPFWFWRKPPYFKWISN